MIIYKKINDGTCRIYLFNKGTVFYKYGYLYYLKKKYRFFGPMVERIIYEVSETRDTIEEATESVNESLAKVLKEIQQLNSVKKYE